MPYRNNSTAILFFDKTHTKGIKKEGVVKNNC
jgi:hypothetical protein